MAREYPILQFDPSPEAIIDPQIEIDRIDAPEHCVFCFHREVVEEISLRHSARILHQFEWESAGHRVFQIEVDRRPIAFLQPGIGAPLAAGLLEGCIALGCRKFIVCGSAGVLDGNIAPEQVIIPTTAVRDEGTSYHYIEPGRPVVPSAAAVDAIKATLRSHEIPFLEGMTWTTDAPYRETRPKVQLRRSEGCITVEMEAAALFAVAAFRNVTLGQMLYGGDDVSGDQWDPRGFKQRTTIREKLFWLAAEAGLRL